MRSQFRKFKGTKMDMTPILKNTSWSKEKQNYKNKKMMMMIVINYDDDDDDEQFETQQTELW